MFSTSIKTSPNGLRDKISLTAEENKVLFKCQDLKICLKCMLPWPCLWIYKRLALCLKDVNFFYEALKLGKGEVFRALQQFRAEYLPYKSLGSYATLINFYYPVRRSIDVADRCHNTFFPIAVDNVYFFWHFRITC